MGSPSHTSTRTKPPGAQLLGRQREREVLARLLDGARGGDGGVLVVHGEPGVGKTALLDWMVEEARQLRVLRAVGVEGEMELPFAALQQLCSPVLDRSERLPGPQRDALGVAFGLSAGLAPNPFLVGLAALGLLSEASEQRPLLESVLPAPLDEDVLDRIVLETHGNPLALLELPRGLTPIELAGGFGLPAAVPLSASIEESFTRRLATLPDDARRLLLIAAADPTGDPAVVWRAARQLGISESVAETVESDNLLELRVRVVFRHPLVRSAVYRAAEPAERHAAHRALAEAI